MSRIIKLWKDPYDTGVKIYRKRQVEFEPGLTVLVGCNGIGKTTLLHNIKDELRKAEVEFISFDNLKDGGHNARSKAGFLGNYEFLATAYCSSEGEELNMNIAMAAGKIGHFIKTNPDCKELWLLFDAVDSGLSIDNIIDTKRDLFNTILEDPRNKDREVYIVVSANSYEMAANERCLDVRNMKYKTFKTYNTYRNYILKTKEWKEERDK